MKLKEYPRPVRKQNVEYRLQIYGGETPADIVKSLQAAHGLNDFPEGAKFEVDLDRGDHYCYCSGECICGCSCSADCCLVWTGIESDFDFDYRVKQYEKLILAQQKRQDKK